MNVNNLGLLNRLSSVINESNVGSSDKIIAEFLIKNFQRIESTSINEIVDNTFVSHSSIRRFCEKLGYNNYTELKKSINDVVYPSNLHARKFQHIATYKKIITEQIKNTILEINDIVNDDIISNLIDLINKYENVLFICPNNTTSNLIKFQQEMFYANKIIRIINNNYDEDFFSGISEESNLIITISVSAVFANEIHDVMKNISSRKILITANHNEKTTAPYDQIICLSKRNIKSDPSGVYGKYGVTYLLDLISEYYIYKYKI